MMRVRLRERHPDEAAFYAERYPQGYDHTVWPDHVERVAETVRFTVRSLKGTSGDSVADLSCGDGVLVAWLATALGASTVHVGDVNAGGRPGAVPQMLPASLDTLPDDGVDLYVCSETLEHLDDPDTFLFRLRPKIRFLLVTTPEGESTDGNPEHYWGWDSEAVGAMLAAAGFAAVHGHQIFTPQYRTPDVIPTQMWMVS